LLCERTVVVRRAVGNGAFRWDFCRVVWYLRTVPPLAATRG